MSAVHTALKTPTRATVVRLRKKRTRQEGKLLISHELKILHVHLAQVPVRELAPYMNF